MSIYCRPVFVSNALDETTVTCLCGWTQTGSPLAARLAYYQHNADCEPIPMPHTHYAPLTTEAPPTQEELQALRHEQVKVRNRWPDVRDKQITRCASCGSQTWRGVCHVTGCWAVMARKEAA